jgi:hypothetical protein
VKQYIFLTLTLFPRTMISKFLVSLSIALVQCEPSELDLYCQQMLGDPASYCKSYQHVPVCHGSDLSCSENELSAWRLRPTDRPFGSTATPHTSSWVHEFEVAGKSGEDPPPFPWSTISMRQQDLYCQEVSNNDGSYCKVRSGRDEATCHISNIDCSRRKVYQHLNGIRDLDDAARTTARPIASSSSSRKTATVTTTAPGVRGAVSTTTTTVFKSTAQQTTTTVATPDPCLMSDAVLMGKSPTSGDSYFVKLPSMRACMLNTKITHANAIWTLHNLYYGVAETYSFTDIVTNTSLSVESNLCNYKLHKVSVDLMGSINSQIAFYKTLFSTMSTDETNRYLSLERPAYDFHVGLLRMMNKLHDAHTLYSTPYDMFRVYFPINFGSKMVGGAQVITLRYTADSSQPIGRLAYAYQRLFGAPPVLATYAGAAIAKINGVPALDFLKSLVGDEGPLANSYQQLEQRLNAFIFNSELLVLGQVLAPLPDFDEVTLEFTDGYRATIKLMGQFADFSTSPYYTTPNLRSTSSLSSYLHSNKAFQAFLAHEKNLEDKKPTLWKHASANAASTLLRIRGLLRAGMAASHWLQMSRKHKALVDPVKNMVRDHLLNLPGDTAEFEEPVAGIVPFVDPQTLIRVIKNALSFPPSAIVPAGELAPIPVFTTLTAMSYTIVGDTIVVKIPSMVPEARFDGDEDFYFFPEFVTVQQAARIAGVRRLVFDVSDNGGGYVISAYALLWYTMADSTRICAPLRKRITTNWLTWIESFGDGLEAVVDRYLTPKGDALADNLDSIFAEIVSLVTVLYDGFGYTYDQFGGVTKTTAIARVNAAKATIAALRTRRAKANAIVTYIKTRKFVPDEASMKDSILPSYGVCPFDPQEMILVDSRRRFFTPSLTNYKNPELKNWGARAANYSQAGEYSFCYDVIQEMPLKATGYETGYWTQISVVSDGTCGSACALFTQGVQTNGDAVSFTYGGIADTALDVASFAGGNVEEYDEFWPGLAFGAKVGSLASGGAAPYSKAHEGSWVSSPIAFPTRAKARFNWNMMFVEAMGDKALPRQFYIIPGRKHFNMWGSDRQSMANLYAQIAAIPNWAAVPAQFSTTNGQCPREATPFTNRQPRRVY